MNSVVVRATCAVRVSQTGWQVCPGVLTAPCTGCRQKWTKCELYRVFVIAGLRAAGRTTSLLHSNR